MLQGYLYLYYLPVLFEILIKDWLVFRIRIRISIELKVGSGPDPHQSDKLDPDRHEFVQMTSQNEWNMSLFDYFFKVLSLYLAAMIRIRIKVKGRIQIRIRIKVTSRIRIIK